MAETRNEQREQDVNREGRERPSKAEGSEKTIEEALDNEERKQDSTSGTG